jgi:GNAT superfamily N-acetyltransferase
MVAEPLRGPEPLRADHDAESFASGSHALDAFLTDRALDDQRARKSRTYVLARGPSVVGYYSLAAAGVEVSQATARAKAGQGRQPIPAILIGRLAVSAAYQGRGLGGALLIDALRRCAAAGEVIGARVVIVHAADADARAFYERYGFEEVPGRPFQLMLLMKDVVATLGASGPRGGSGPLDPGGPVP